MADQEETPEFSRMKTYESIRRETTHAPTHRTRTNESRRRRSLSQSNTHLSHKETHRDPNIDINLPYRTFTENANLEEYTAEKPEGEIDGGLTPDGQGHYKLVTFTPNDPGNPKNWSKPYK